MAKIMDLIFLLFDVASAQDVPFAMLLYIQWWTYQGLSLCPIHLCSPWKVLILWWARDGFNSLSIIFIDLDLVLYNKYSLTSNFDIIESPQHHLY